MSRRERRAQKSAERKSARDAKPGEIFPERHGPIQATLAGTMQAAVEVLRERLGSNFDVTLFVAERLPSDGSDRLPRFNYISTAARPDMIAVLKAFIEKQAVEGPKLDKIEDEPPTESRQ
ncbi:hypothetical protein MA20_42670 [Bradyrhizobium japonicum]|uniref:Uncharacterized protein n=1 Tax=Bradyrhizobium japonicum TaxID=375 RepID=A0A0A3YIY8_BRAJP|nr:hypothetical protein [Bradyrhizobium japonicum]KGT73663.1 hypothetical protein MA20_42670 [Bradyrhizobium japonicum]